MVINMAEHIKQVPAGQFKAKCLQLMDDVKKNHCAITITKRGIPVARLVPIEQDEHYQAFGSMKGTVIIKGDIVSPTDEEWEADSD